MTSERIKSAIGKMDRALTKLESRAERGLFDRNKGADAYRELLETKNQQLEKLRGRISLMSGSANSGEDRERYLAMKAQNTELREQVTALNAQRKLLRNEAQHAVTELDQLLGGERRG